MPKVTVNGQEIEVQAGATVLQACEQAGEEIPRFCYHERLKIAGNCRMCLVEVQPGPPKPAASCAMPAGEGMKIFTNTPMVKKAREGVMEFLLINHPLDCPICDQAGECDLQDQSVAYGKGGNRFDEHKRTVKDKYMGPIVKTSMTRCIQCTRCIRFMDDVAGVPELGATSRGEHMEVGTYIEKGLSSELSGNIIDLCPVGALTSKPYAYKARPWELKKTETIDILDAVGSNIRADSRGNEVLRILPRLNEDINEEWISDKTRYGFEGLKFQRLDRPYIRKRGKLQAVSWEEAIFEVSEILAKTNPDKVAAIAGDLADCESMLVLKNLLQSLGIRSYDCRQDGTNYDATNRASYTFSNGIANIEKSDLIILIGANPRYEAPLVNTRIRKTQLQNKIPVAVIGSDVDLTYPTIYLGAETTIIEDIIAGKHPFSAKLEKAKNPLIIIGNSIFKRVDSHGIYTSALRLAQKYNAVREDWNGLNSLQKAAGRVGGLDIGFVPDEKGRTTNEILAGGGNGDLEVVFLLGADEININALEKPLVIYQGHHGDIGASRADIILPSAAYTEKSATYVNLEGRAQRTELVVFPVGGAREDWKIINDISAKLNKRTYNDIDEVRSELAKINSAFANIDTVVKEKYPDPKNSPQKVTNRPIETEFFNFYLTDPISRMSKTMNACNKEFGEIKGFWKRSEVA
jgi:NADH-quinone oxidoreductase subunit G